MSRWSRMTPEQRRRKLDSNNRWRHRNVTTVRLWGRRLYRKHALKRRKHAIEQYRKQVTTDPTFLARMNARSTQYYRRHKRTWVNNYLIRKYKVTIEQYEQMFAAQNGRCGICGSTANNRLNIDHCHKTGKVRGLLCMKCNFGMGLLQDNPQLLRKAIKWLQSRR